MAEQKTLQLNIARVDGSLFMGEVVSVTVPGSEGEMTLLPDHTPLVSALRAGTITLRKADGEAEEFVVVAGIFEVRKTSVIILLKKKNQPGGGPGCFVCNLVGSKTPRNT